MFDRKRDWKQVLARLGEQVQATAVESLPSIQCVTCQDTGYYTLDVHYTDARFGKMYPCDNPECAVKAKQRRAQSAAVMEQSTWEQDYGALTFDSFAALMEKHGDWTGKRAAYAAALAFAVYDKQPFTLRQAAQYAFQVDMPGADDRASQSLVLTGDVGLGKTGLATGATNELRAQDKNVVFIRTLDLIERVQETYREDWQGKTADQVKGFFARVDYLILDEFGIKSYTNNRLETLEDIIRERDRRGLPFLLTTNLTVEQVYDLWQPQIADIVAKAHWVEVGGVKLRHTTRKVVSW